MSEWWERIVEDMVRQKFVLVIDEVGVLDRLQRGLLAKLLTQELKKYVEDQRKILVLELLREELLGQLSGLRQVLAQPKPTVSAVWERIALSEKVLKDLETFPNRLRLEIAHVYGERLEQEILEVSREVKQQTRVKSGTDEAAVLAEPGDANVSEQRKALKTEDLKNLLPAVRRLEAVRRSLGWALRVLADRRSQARIVITADSRPREFLDLSEDVIFEMRLAPLTWAETWRWIRRNLPGLVRFGEDHISPIWFRFGAHLEPWEQLERLVLKKRNQTVNLIEIARTVHAPPTKRTAVSEQTARRGHRALRIAIAGPFLKGPVELAEAINRLARYHGIDGHVVLDSREPVPVLIEESSLFSNGMANQSDILLWLDRVTALQPDIILLDYGAPYPIKDLNKQISVSRSLFQHINHSSLLIAAGGNEVRPPGTPTSGKKRQHSMVTVPSAYPEVLGVGPLSDDGRLRDYAEWRPQLGKPDLFMTDNLAVTPLAIALRSDDLKRMTELGTWGSSFSALHAVATAALVWSLLPNLSPYEIRELLVEAGQPVPGTEAARGLTMESAIALARRRVVKETLEESPASLQTLSAITGLEGRVLSAILEQMEHEERVVRLATGRLERFQLLR